MGYAFISYSTKNQTSADAMRELFNRKGIETWMAPYDIPAGSKYAAVINRAVKDCACFVLVLSDCAQNSIWVAKEVERAVNYRKPVIPVQIEDVILNDEFEFYISTDQVVAVQKMDSESEDVKKLLASVITFAGATVEEPIVEPLDTPAEDDEKTSNSDFEIVDGVLVKYHGTSDCVTIPETVTEIGEGAFGWRDDITRVIIPEGVTKIGDEAFDLCENLSEINLPSTIREIGKKAFSYCKLKEVRIPAGVTRIEAETFSHCELLTKVEISMGVVEIGVEAFSWCERIETVTIPHGVARIGGRAFNGCKALKDVYLPNSIVQIGNDTFRFCDSLVIHAPKMSPRISVYALRNGIRYVVL